MKKEITTAFMTLATAFGFAQDAEQATIVQLAPTLPAIETKIAPKRSFGYLVMGVSDSKLPTELPKDTGQMLPGLGLGYRIVAGASAFDISSSINLRNRQTDEGNATTYQYTLPKANYFYYLTEARNNSLYAGGGIAVGGFKTKAEQESHGLITGNLAVGFEMNRNNQFRSFIQLDVSQPAIAAFQRGDLPKAYAELALGAGF